MVRLMYLIILAVTAVSARRHAPFYRRDYTYIDEYDAFYKVHWDRNGKNFNSAFVTCIEEGAELFYPTGDEWKVVKTLFERMSTSPNETEVIVGIHDKFNFGEYINIRGQLTHEKIQNLDNTITGPRCVTMNIDTGLLYGGSCIYKHEHHPYICKKVEEPYCPTIDKGYMYNKETKKCYKIHGTPMTWSNALDTCFMEGGLLVTLDSVEEAYVVKRNINSNQRYFIGYLYHESNFYSVKGGKLENTDVLSWGGRRDSYEDCGTFVMSGDNYSFDPSECDVTYSFICVMDAQS